VRELATLTLALVLLQTSSVWGADNRLIAQPKQQAAQHTKTQVISTLVNVGEG
jgi:hypothetical protein